MRNTIMLNETTNDVLSTSSRPGRKRYDNLVNQGYRPIGSCSTAAMVRPDIPSDRERNNYDEERRHYKQEQKLLDDLIEMKRQERVKNSDANSNI